MREGDDGMYEILEETVPLLPQKAAKVCYDRLTELARAMKAHLEEF